MPSASVGKLEICYDVRGEGPPLLLIMGFSAQMVLWEDEFCDAIAAHGFTVVRMDNRDIGLSSKLDHLGVPDVRKTLLRTMLGLSIEAPYTLDDMADDSVGLMRSLGFDRFHVVGASMGGMIAQTIAVSQPERLLSLTSIMSTPGGRRYLGKPNAIGALLKKPAKTNEAAIEQFVDLFRTIAGTGFVFREDRFREIAKKSVERGLSPRGAARQFAAILAAGSKRVRLLPKVRVPTLVIHGTDDPLIPLRAGAATARLIPGAEFIPVKGMGHDLPIDAYPLLVGAIATHALKSTARAG